MSKLAIVAGIAIGLSVQSAAADERGAGMAGVSSAKSVSSEKPAFSGDIRDCLYAAYGSKGINHHLVKKYKPWKWYRTVKGCFHCNYGKSDS